MNNGTTADAVAGQPASRRGFRGCVGFAVHAVACFALLFVGPLPSAQAQTTRTWDNSVTTGLWSGTGSWLGNVVPTSTTDIAAFSSTNTGLVLTATGAATPSIGQLYFDNAGTTTLQLNRITLNSGTGIVVTANSGNVFISNTSVGTTTNSPVVVATNQIWRNDSTSGTLSVQTNGGSIFVSSTNTLTIAGSGATRLGTFSATRLIYDGSGVLTLTGTQANAGALTIRSGTLRNEVTNTSSPFGSGTTVIDGGAIAQVGTGTTAATLLINKSFSLVSGTLQVATGNAISRVGTDPVTISVDSGAALEFRSDAGLMGAGQITKRGSGTLLFTRNTGTGWSGGLRLEQGLLVVQAFSGGNGNAPLGTGTFTIAGGTISAGTGYSGPLSMPSRFESDVILAGASSFNLGTGTVTLNATRTVNVLNSAATFTIGGPIVGGAFGLTKDGPGQLTLSGSSTYTGLTTVSSGTLRFGDGPNGGPTGSVDGNIANNSVVVFNRSNAQTYGGVISGTGTLTKLQANVLTLTGENTFTGATTVSSGTLQIGDGGATGSIASNIANSGAVVFNRSSDLTYGGTISGGGSFTKRGAGTLTLTGSNTYSGVTTVSSGTLDIGGGGTTGWIGSNRTVNNDSTIVFNRSNNVTFSQEISGTGNLIKLGSGTLSITNSNQGFSGTTEISGGAIVLDGNQRLQFSGIVTDTGNLRFSGAQSQLFFGGLIGSRNLGLLIDSGLSTGNNSITLQPAAGRSFSYSGVIANLGSSLALIKTSPGEQILTGLSTFSGAVTINQGTLTVDKILNSGSDSPLGRSGTINFSSASAGILRYTGAGETTNRLFTLTNGANVTGGIENNGSGALVISSTITGASGTNIRLFRLMGTNSGTNQIVSISGTNVSVEKSGPGTWWLTGASTYTGTTTVLGGTLQIGNGGTGGSIVSNIVNSANVVFDRSDNLAYAGIISGTGGLTKRGAGQLTLNGASTFTGPMTIAEGTVNTGVNNALSGSSAITIGGPTTRGFLKIDHDLTISNLTFTGSGGDVANGSTGQATFLAASGTAVINVISGSNAFHANATLSSPTLVDVNSGAYFSFHNNLAGGSSLTKSGAGTMNLTGDNDTLSGNLFVTGGMVTIGTGMNQIGTGTTTLSGGATIDLGGQSFTDRIVVLNGTILNAGGTATTTTIEGQSAIDGSAAGTYNITSTGSAVFNATVGSGTSFVNVNVNTGAGSGGRATFAAAVGTNGNIVVENGGSAAFQSTVAGSVISHGVSSFAGNVLSTSEVSVQPGGLASFAAGMAGHANVDGTAFFSGAVSGTAEIYGSGTFGSTSSLTGKLFTGTSATALLDNLPGTISAAIHNDGQLRIDRTSGSQIISGVIIGSGTLTKTGAGQLTLTGENTFHGVTTVSEGTLQIGNGGAVGSIGGDIANNAAVVFNRSNNLEYAGIISGGGSLTKQGAGRLTLTGQSTFNGVTNVSAGILEISNGGVINSTSGVTVNGAGAEFKYNSSTSFNRPLTLTQGILSGTGTINTAVSVAANAIISPGNSPGSQTYTSSEWLQNGTYLWELNAMTGVAGTNWDQVTITNLLNLTGLSASNKFNLNLTTLNGSNTAGPLDVGYVSGQSYIFPFVTFGSLSVPAPFSNTANSDLTSLFNISLVNWQGTKPSAQDISVKVNSGGTGLDLVIVPEPATIALAAIGIGVAAWALRRRRVTA